MVNLFLFDDYRHYLRAFYADQKQRRRGFSFRGFAKQAGLASPNYLKLVIEGERRITDKSLPQFLRGLKLSAEEESYFRCLVSFQESKDQRERQNSKIELDKLRSFNMRRVSELEEPRMDYLRSWHHMAVRELVTLEGFSPDPQYVAKALKGRISPAQATESLELLLKLGLLKVVDGKYLQSEPLLTAGDDATNKKIAPLVQNIYRQMSDLAMETLSEDAVEQREMSGLTIAVPLARLGEIKSAIKRFRRELNQSFSCDEKNGAVYYLAVQFFPLTAIGEQCEK